uniref:Craniofacial development protein 1 n=1 Tax=Panagrolaimus superbus TaxID=310955 RepID=A0A914Z6L3_9BILA
MSSTKPFNALVDDYLSEDDEDYCPTANEEAEADAALKEFGLSTNDQDEVGTSKTFKLDPEVDKMWDDFLVASEPKKSLFAPESDEEIEETKSDTGKSEEANNGGKRKIVEVYDFFGENVTREREVDEEEAKKIEEKKAKAAEKKPKYLRVQGIEALIKKIDKNPKMTIVEKSHVDWQRHVKKQKLEDDLQKYDKSKSSFLDNAKFAQKAADAEYLLSKKK